MKMLRGILCGILQVIMQDPILAGPNQADRSSQSEPAQTEPVFSHYTSSGAAEPFHGLDM
jgi:hypothetical protein